MQVSDTEQYLNALQQQYPQAFKGNYLLYSLIKTNGVLEDKKEGLVWLLAVMIFVLICVVIRTLLLHYFPAMPHFDAWSYASLLILLFFMLFMPFIIKQIKHSSHSLYRLLRHSPLKLTVIIVLHSLNWAFIHSIFLLCLLFFLGLSFGFVRFYKENMFKAHSNHTLCHQLQQSRRACYWAYKQTVYLRCKLLINRKAQLQQRKLKQQLKQFADLHVQLYKLEHQLCKHIKYLDIDSYLDEKL